MYQLQNIHSNKSFFIQRSELAGRLEAEYYKPSLFKIEELIRRRASKKLKDFIIRIASGATPSLNEEEKYYGNKETGIPFLRVQNLQPNGELNLEDVKYINKETHEIYLKRSQVNEYDLLVKITGVGRMAIASVAPKGFVGNTNQHMVVIKTGSKERSEYLAKYLNLDIVEKLASRRATGATRPALDYAALKSIPIIDNLDFSLLDEAEKRQRLLMEKAYKLENDIERYLFQELDIKLKPQENNLAKRIFISNFRELSGARFDPFNITLKEKRIEGGKYENILLGKIAKISKGRSITKDTTENGIYPVIAGGQSSPYKHNVFNFNGNVITVSASGAYAGFVWYHENPIFASDCSVIQSKNETNVSTLFISEVLKLKQSEIYTLQQGAGQPHVYSKDLFKLKIPLPVDINKQLEIVDTIKKYRKESSRIREEANQIMQKAKEKIEEQIVNG